MRKKIYFYLTLLFNAFCILLVFISITCGTETRVYESGQEYKEVNKIAVKSGTEIKWNFDTKGKDIVGIQLKCVQNGRMINSGYLNCSLYDKNGEFIQKFVKSLKGVNIRDDYLNFEFENILNGQYTLSGRFTNFSTGDELLLFYDSTISRASIEIDEDILKGDLVYNNILISQTFPYMLYTLILLALVNMFFVIFLRRGRK